MPFNAVFSQCSVLDTSIGPPQRSRDGSPLTDNFIYEKGRGDLQQQGKYVEFAWKLRQLEDIFTLAKLGLSQAVLLPVN